VKNGDDRGPFDAIGALRRQRWLVLGVTAAVAAVAVGFSLFQDEEYTASATVFSRNPAAAVLVNGPKLDKSGYQSALVAPRPDPDRELISSAELAQLDTVANHTANRIGGGLNGEEIDSRVGVEPVLDSDVLRVEATAGRPTFAAELANAFAREYIAFRYDRDRSKIGDANRLVKQELARGPTRRAAASVLRSKRLQLWTLQVITALQTGNLQVVERAKPPSSPSSPKPVRNGLLGVALGLLLGIALGLIRDRRSARSRIERPVRDEWVDRVAPRGHR
jgi:uncharacterized protein involved in exopolysaccharide biosynthesis